MLANQRRFVPGCRLHIAFQFEASAGSSQGAAISINKDRVVFTPRLFLQSENRRVNVRTFRLMNVLADNSTWTANCDRKLNDI